MSIVVGQSTWQLRPGRIIDGGNLICKSGGNLWIVAPSSSEVTRIGTAAGDAVTQATNVTGKTGWFLPSISQSLPVIKLAACLNIGFPVIFGSSLPSFFISPQFNI